MSNHHQYQFNSNTRRHAISYSNKTFDPKNKDDNFENTSLTHSRFHNCIFPKINFEKAAITGSLFENCKFICCNLNDADLEFCDFRGCEFEINVTDGTSFNNSNFIKTIISGEKFINCTFTGAYFDYSTINKIGLEFSTLEGACFQKCEFYNIDWRNLNLEYVEIIKPKMSNVVLPFHQIPFMFGILQYIVTTNDSIKVSNGGDDNGTIDKNTYLTDGIEYLINEYKKQNNLFPLSNIYLFGPNTDYNQAFDYLAKEISSLASVRDFRGIKFCCKLISDSEIFERNKLNKLYKIITGIDQSLDENSPEMKSFTRNIGDIRRILYRKKKVPHMSIKLKTNIGIEYSMRFANLIHQFQQIAKPNHSDRVFTSIQLSNNSPLIIDVSVEGDKTYFVPILYNFFILSGKYDTKALSLILDRKNNLSTSIDIQHQPSIIESIKQTTQALKLNDIDIEILEYNIEGVFWTANQNCYDLNLQKQLIEPI